jgi:MFS transporter, DHA1 family, multidrug resistance protein
MGSAQTISASAKTRGLYTILADTFLMWGGFFMVIPLLSIYYVERLGWAAASIGVVLAVRQFTQQGLTPISGMLADRLGAKSLICAGLLLRTVGFASMAWADTFPLLILSAVLAALGGSMFESPKSAAVAALTDEANRGRYFALNGVVSQLGLTIGTQVGALLLAFNFSVVALVSAACFFLTFLVTLIFMPSVKVASGTGSLTDGVKLALHDTPFVKFNVLLIGYWFLWVQLSLSLPLAAQNVGGGAETVGWIYAINAGLSIMLQYPLLKLASKWLRPMSVLIVGMVLMAAGLGAIALATDVQGLLVCVVVFALGALLATPSQQTVTANLANPVALGSYFGISSLGLAIGGGLGNLCGGLLYDIGKGMSFPELPWTVFFVVGMGAAAGLSLLWARLRRAERTPAAVQMPTQEQPHPGEVSPAMGDAAK